MPPPPSDAAVTASVTAMVAAHAQARERLQDVAVQAASEIVRSFGAWYDTKKITKMARDVVAAVEGPQRATASITDAYLTRVVTTLRGRQAKPVGAVGVGDLRDGVTHEGAYGRLADQSRYLLSTGLDEQTVNDRAVERAAVMASTDTDLAFRAQAQKVMIVRRVDGYRRVIHPELSLGGTCGLCIVASDRVYSSGDLMPIHARCRCTILPIVNGRDIGYRLNKGDLSTLYADAGATAADKLKRTRYVVHEHGELGPQLRAAGDGFRGPGDLAAA